MAQEESKPVTTAFDRLGELISSFTVDQRPGYDTRDLQLIAVALLLFRSTYKMPEMTPVKHSSNILAVGYSKEWNELWVHFKNGGIYVYVEVPPAPAEAMLAADSKGGYLAANIKGKYKFKKVDTTPANDQAPEAKRAGASTGAP